MTPKKLEKMDCECPTYQLLETLSKKWVMMIMRIMCGQKEVRFTDIKNSLPDINSRILSQRLTELEDAGFLVRSVTNSKPIVISYELTQKALDLKKVFRAFHDWGEKWGK